MREMEPSSTSNSLLAGGGHCTPALLSEGDSSHHLQPFGMWHGICFTNSKSICSHTMVVTSALSQNTKYHKYIEFLRGIRRFPRFLKLFLAEHFLEWVMK